MIVMLLLASRPVTAADACWHTLGTAGGPPIHESQAQISNALTVADAVYLFDVGSGVLRQMDAAKLPVRNLRAVFLTHHHMDHNADLGPVLLSWWLFGTGEALPIHGPLGTTTLVEGLIAANAPTVSASFPTGRAPAKPPLVSIVEPRNVPRALDQPTLVYDDDNVRVTAIDVDHFQVSPSTPMDVMPQAIAYRVEIAERTYVFSGDTGPSKKLESLARDADVLITEVVDLDAIRNALRELMKGAPQETIDELVDGMGKNHLTADAIGQLAAKAEVGHVVLTHYVPAVEDMPDPESLKRGVARTFDGPVSLAKDLDCF